MASGEKRWPLTKSHGFSKKLPGVGWIRRPSTICLQRLSQSCARSHDGSCGTAIVNEAYARLVGRELQLQSRTHFYRVAVRAMRQVLVDYARRRVATKRGGKQPPAPLLVDVAITGGAELEILALDRALTGLEGAHERMARVVELRFFGGLTSEEIAAALGVSRRTVQDDWKVARMWLGRALSVGA